MGSFYRINKNIYAEGDETQVVFREGDILLMDSLVHSLIAKVATPSQRGYLLWCFPVRDFKQLFIEKQFVDDLKIWELRKIYPHLTKRMKTLAADYQLKPILPKAICLDCGRKNNQKFDKNAKPKIAAIAETGAICPLCNGNKYLSLIGLFGIHHLDGYRNY